MSNIFRNNIRNTPKKSSNMLKKRCLKGVPKGSSMGPKRSLKSFFFYPFTARWQFFLARELKKLGFFLYINTVVFKSHLRDLFFQIYAQVTMSHMLFNRPGVVSHDLKKKHIFNILSVSNRKSWGAEIERECSPPTMCHTSCVSCHMSCVMCQLSGVRLTKWTS